MRGFERQIRQVEYFHLYKVEGIRPDNPETALLACLPALSLCHIPQAMQMNDNTSKGGKRVDVAAYTELLLLSLGEMGHTWSPVKSVQIQGGGG